MKMYYYGHSLYTRGKPLASHVEWLRQHDFMVVSLSPAYPPHLAELGANSIHQSVPDGRLSPAVLADFLQAKEWIVERASQNRPVLTHCNAGRNRAAFLTGLAYADLAGVSGAEAFSHVRQIRPNSLANDDFAEYLMSYKP
jgi:protein-tyrosine phosphatase